MKNAADSTGKLQNKHSKKTGTARCLGEPLTLIFPESLFKRAIIIFGAGNLA
jgi:hypothetical protein